MSAPAAGRVGPWRQAYWDWRAACNFIGGGSGAGVLLFAAVVPQSGRLLSLLGTALVGGGLLCVWLEIGRPWRALNVFRHPRTSWMSREALVAPLLLASGLAGAWYGARPWLWTSAGLGLIYVYCQARMLNAGRGVPAWRHPRLVPLLLASALAEGWGVGLATLAGSRDGLHTPWVAWFLCCPLIVRMTAFLSYRDGVAQTGAPRRAIEELARLARMLVPLDAVAAALAATVALVGALAGPGRPEAWAIAAAGLVAAAAGWRLKYTIVVRAAYNQGFALPLTPVRGAGTTRRGTQPGW